MQMFNGLMCLCVAFMVACGGERPHRSDYHSSPTQGAKAAEQNGKSTKSASSGVSGKTDTKNMGSTDQKPSDSGKIPPIEANKPNSKLAIRSVASAAEITAAKSSYGTDCGGCHQALATSAKKGATLSRIEAAGVAGKVLAHNTLVNASQWPKDIKDTLDDGADTAMLKASAMVEALK